MTKKNNLAKIISMMNQKGGSGKTTICQHTAITIASTGKKVLIIDTDKQLTCFKFFVRNHEQFPNGYDGVIDVAKGDVDVLQDLIEKQSSNYDYIFIDTSPALGADMGAIVGLSNLVVVCVQPTFKDIEATESFAKAIESHQVNDPSIMAAICITRKPTNCNIEYERKEIFALGLHVMGTEIREYPKAYNGADRAGVGIIHLDKFPSVEKAASDIHSFTNELLSFLEI